MLLLQGFMSPAVEMIHEVDLRSSIYTASPPRGITGKLSHS